MAGPWLSLVSESSAHTARLTRAITNHAPTGEFRKRFKLSQETNCKCFTNQLETRGHILNVCPLYKRSGRSTFQRREMQSFIRFLEENPRAFSFPSDAPPIPFPAPKRKRKKGRRKPLTRHTKSCKQKSRNMTTEWLLAGKKTSTHC